MSRRAAPPSAPVAPVAPSRVSNLLTFTREELLASQIRGLSIGPPAGGKRALEDSEAEYEAKAKRLRTLRIRRQVAILLEDADTFAEVDGPMVSFSLILAIEQILKDPALAVAERERLSFAATRLRQLIRDQRFKWPNKRISPWRRRDDDPMQVLPPEPEPDARQESEPGQAQDQEPDASQPPEPDASGSSRGGGGGNSQLFSQLAEDLDRLDDEELEPPEEAQGGEGPATELEGMELVDDARGSRAGGGQLQKLRDDVVKLLREAPVDGGLPRELRESAETLKRNVKRFAAANEAARRMLSALTALLASPPANEPARDAVGPGAEDPAPQADQPRIVGRATDVRVAPMTPVGTHRQTFLLFTPTKKRNQYEWLTEDGMLADPQLATILANYTGSRGDDPNDRGFVTAVLDAKGTTAVRQYKVQWTVEPQVPLQRAQEWMSRARLVTGAQAMVDAYERQDDPDSEEEDDVNDAESGGAGLDEQTEDGTPRAGGLTLQWDPASGKPKLSLRQAISVHVVGHEWTLKALVEYTLTRIWALRSRTPPPPLTEGAPLTEELEQLGEDLYSVDAKALDALFKREQKQAARDAAADAAADEGDEEEGGEEDEEDEEEEEEEGTLAENWRKGRERELRDEAVARWASTRQTNARDLSTLRAQLAAVKAVQAAGGSASAVTLVDIEAVRTAEGDTVADLLLEWQKDEEGWPAQLARPRLRLPRIRDFLSTPGRSAIAKGWLTLQRDIHSAATAQERRSGVFGSAYSATWPSRPGPVEIPPDHVVPTRWYQSGTVLLLEAGDPGQLPAVVPSRLSENSAKGDAALGLFSGPDERSGGSGQDVYTPRSVSDPKKALLAKTTAWCFALYPLISNKKRGAGIGSYARNTGVEWYARAWQNGPFQQLVRARATKHERRIALLCLAMPRWQVANPLIFEAGLLDDDTEQLLLDRFRGTDALSMLVDAALQGAVRGAPR